jgi:uncharacterized membrane protein YfcA
LLSAKSLLFAALGVVTLVFVAAWIRAARRRARVRPPGPLGLAIGFVTNFFDTLGIGSFAPTTSIFKLKGLVPDERIPGTLNVGHALPTIAQAFIFIAIVEVEMTTLIGLIAASVAGRWLGAGVVSRWPRRPCRSGMGFALWRRRVLRDDRTSGSSRRRRRARPGLAAPVGRPRRQLRPRRADDARDRASTRRA